MAQPRQKRTATHNRGVGPVPNVPAHYGTSVRVPLGGGRNGGPYAIQQAPVHFDNDRRGGSRGVGKKQSDWRRFEGVILPAIQYPPHFLRTMGPSGKLGVGRRAFFEGGESWTPLPF